MKAKSFILSDTKTGAGEVDLPESVFGVPANPELISRTVVWQLAKRRSGCHSTKTRSEVSHTTAKPYKQKGTGRARQGSLVGPHMRGGGVSFGPKPRSHAVELPKKQRKLALKMALSVKYEDEAVAVISEVALSKVSTKNLFVALQRENAHDALIVTHGDVANLNLSARNLPRVKCIGIEGLNVYDILSYKKVLFTADALNSIKESHDHESE